MDLKDLEYKEHQLRECFKKELEHLNVDGQNDMQTIRCIKTYGALWHYTHQLLMAEHVDKVSAVESTGSLTTADTMNVQATGLRMVGSSK